MVECVTSYPACIQDVSVNGQNALNLAAMNDRFEVLHSTYIDKSLGVFSEYYLQALRFKSCE